MANAESVDVERFVGAMSGPTGRGGWPVASLDIRRDGEVRLQGSLWSWKLRPPHVVWQPGQIRLAENVRGILSSREGIESLANPAHRQSFGAIRILYSLLSTALACAPLGPIGLGDRGSSGPRDISGARLPGGEAAISTRRQGSLHAAGASGPAAAL